MLDERESLRDKVYTLAEGGHSLFDEKGDSDWDTIDDNWVEYQKRTWGIIELRAEENLPILRLQDMPPRNTKYHERLMYSGVRGGEPIESSQFFDWKICRRQTQEMSKCQCIRSHSVAVNFNTLGGRGMSLMFD